MTQGKKKSWAIKLFKKKPTPWLKYIDVITIRPLNLSRNFPVGQWSGG